MLLIYYSVSMKMFKMCGKMTVGIRFPNISLFVRRHLHDVLRTIYLSISDLGSVFMICTVFTPKFLCVLHTLHIFEVYWLRWPLLQLLASRACGYTSEIPITYTVCKLYLCKKHSNLPKLKTRSIAFVTRDDTSGMSPYLRKSPKFRSSQNVMETREQMV